MITDYEVIQLVQALYDKPEASFDHISNSDEVYAGVKSYPNCTAVIFRGSTTFLDWLRDFQGAMLRTDNIGGVEMGFYTGLVKTLETLSPFINKDLPVLVGGHSLGGGRAAIFAAILVVAGYDVEVVTFGAPRPGDATLKKILAPYPVRPYKNGNDYVTDVPIPIHPLLPYEHMRDLIMVNAPPPRGDIWGLLARHHSQLYLAALTPA